MSPRGTPREKPKEPAMTSAALTSDALSSATPVQFKHEGKPSKLSSGEWGVRVEGSTPVERGDKVRVKTAAGKTWISIIANVVSVKEGITICTVQPRQTGCGGTRNSSSRRRYRSREAYYDSLCDVCGKNKYTCGHCVGW